MRIREAGRNDIKTIWQLTRELAEYEGALSIFTVKEAFFEEALFGKNPKAKYYLLEVADQVIGMGQVSLALGTYSGSYSLFLENFIIKKEYRGKGYGRKFINFLADLCQENNYSRITWNIATWQKETVEFYKKMGAMSVDGVSLMYIPASPK